MAVGNTPGDISPYGVHDMAGNVTEWTSDWYNPGFYQHQDSVQNPTGPFVSTSVRTQRGGSFFSDVYGIQVMRRGWTAPVNGLDSFGIRCVRTYEQGVAEND